MTGYENEKRINVELFIATFCITISHLLTYSLSVFRWIGIFILTIEIFYHTRKCGFKRVQTNRFIAIFVVLLMCAVLCQTTLLQKMVSILYYLTLLIWFSYSGNLIRYKENILAMGLGGGIACLLGLFMTRNLINSQMNNMFITRRRIYGGFAHPNILGAMLATAILEVALFIYFSKKKFLNVLLLGYIFVLSVMLYYTNSRTAIFMLIGGVMGLLFLKINKFPYIIRYLSYIVIFLMIIYFIRTYIVGYVLTDEAYGGRIYGLFNTGDYSIIQKIFGHGMTSSSETVGAHGKEIAWASIYFKLGTIGIFVYVYMIIVFIIGILKIHDLKKKQAAIACIVFMLLSTFGDPYIINIANSASVFMWAVTSAVISGKFQVDHIT